jgi:hypothetical protein
VTNVAWVGEAKAGALDEDGPPVRDPAAARAGGALNRELMGDRHLIVPNDDGVNVDFFLGRSPPRR